MAEQQAYLRIREGAFTFLLAVGQAVSIERRNRGAFETGAVDSHTTAWLRSGEDRVPVVRLGALMNIAAAEWEYAIVLADGTQRIGVAAEHIYLIPEPDVPAVQAFNPIGMHTPGGPVITGLCPRTDPEYLVLDPGRLGRSLGRAAIRSEG